MKSYQNINLIKSKSLDDWYLEIANRKKFGISDEKIQVQSGVILGTHICFKQDFLYLYNRIKSSSKNPQYKKIIQQYINYTFKQVEDGNGAVELSKICTFSHVIVSEGIEHDSKRMALYHRIKNAVKEGNYPEEVRAIFRGNHRCKAVLWLFKQPLRRKVIVEKSKILAKKNNIF